MLILSLRARLRPEAFKAAFVGPEGWGSFEQKVEDGRAEAAVHVRWGRVRIRTLKLGNLPGRYKTVEVRLDGKPVPAELISESRVVQIQLEREVQVKAGQRLETRLL